MVREHIKELFNNKLKVEKVMTQAELAKICDVKPATITKWLNGENIPDVEKIVPICNALGVTLYEFFGVEDDRVALTENEKTFLEQIKSNPDLESIILKIANK